MGVERPIERGPPAFRIATSSIHRKQLKMARYRNANSRVSFANGKGIQWSISLGFQISNAIRSNNANEGALVRMPPTWSSTWASCPDRHRCGDLGCSGEPRGDELPFGACHDVVDRHLGLAATTFLFSRVHEAQS